MSEAENPKKKKELPKCSFLHVSTEDDISSLDNLEKLFDNANPDYVIDLLVLSEGHAAKA